MTERCPPRELASFAGLHYGRVQRRLLGVQLPGDHRVLRVDLRPDALHQSHYRPPRQLVRGLQTRPALPHAPSGRLQRLPQRLEVVRDIPLRFHRGEDEQQQEWNTARRDRGLLPLPKDLGSSSFGPVNRPVPRRRLIRRRTNIPLRQHDQAVGLHLQTCQPLT